MKVKNTKNVNELFIHITKEKRSLQNKNDDISRIKYSLLTDVLLNMIYCEEIAKKLSKK